MAAPLLPVSTILSAAFGLLACLGLLLFGIRAVRSGKRGVRVGRTPHCAKCDYNLTGNAAGRCPECGADLHAAGAVASGVRRIAWPRVLTGVLLILVAAGVLLAGGRWLYRAVRWYALKPVAWVFQDAQTGSGWVQQEGLNELCNRARAQKLSPDEVLRLADLLLAGQGAPKLGAFSTYSLVTLAKLLEAGQLAEAQAARFRQQSQLLSLEVRSVAISGYQVFARLRCESRVWPPLFTAGSVAAVRCDGEPIAVGEHKWACHSAGSSETWQFPVPVATPGRHSIACDVRCVIQRFVETSRTFEDLPDAELRTLTAEFEVLAEKPEGYIKLVQSADLDRELRRSFQMEDFYIVRQPQSALLRGWIALTPPAPPAPGAAAAWQIATGPPVGVAFDVTATVGEHKSWLGRFTAAKNAYSAGFGRWYVDGTIPLGVGDRVEIRLVPSEDAAMQTVDLFEIYGGEVDLGTLSISELDQSREKREAVGKAAFAAATQAAAQRALATQPAATQPVATEPTAAQPTVTQPASPAGADPPK